MKKKLTQRKEKAEQIIKEGSENIKANLKILEQKLKLFF